MCQPHKAAASLDSDSHRSMLLQLKLGRRPMDCEWKPHMSSVQCPKAERLTMGDKRMLREKGKLPTDRDLD